jgi:exodeoxyribonuclease VII small subunit
MKKKTWNYEAAIAKVEETIAKIESEDLDLDQVFSNFSTAVEELQKCEQFLTLLTSNTSRTQVLPAESPEKVPNAVPAIPEMMPEHRQQMQEQMQQLQTQMQQMMSNMEEMSPEQRKVQMQQMLDQMQQLQDMMEAHHNSMEPGGGMMGKPHHPAEHPIPDR